MFDSKFGWPCFNEKEITCTLGSGIKSGKQYDLNQFKPQQSNKPGMGLQV